MTEPNHSGAVQLATLIRRGNAGDVPESSTDVATHAFKSGLQDFLTTLVAVMTADVAERMEVPPGFTATFQAATSSPTHGKLLQLLVRYAPKMASGRLDELYRYVHQVERKPTGWLARLVSLRNEWAHPKARSSAEVLKEAAVLLEKPPEVLSRGAVRVDPDRGVCWVFEDGEIPLPPFAFDDGGQVRFFSEFEPPRTLAFAGAEWSDAERFGRLWSALRVLDDALESPTLEELHEKVRRAAKSHEGDAPWWLERVLEKGPAVFLLEPGQMEGALAGLSSQTMASSGIDLELAKGSQIPDVLKDRIGLARALAAKDLVDCTDVEHPLVLGARCSQLKPLEFMEVLFWLWDLQEQGWPMHLRILAERSFEQLEGDQERLWDRLPGDLDRFLRRPPKAKGARLSAFLWTRTKPKRFLGLF